MAAGPGTAQPPAWLVQVRRHHRWSQPRQGGRRPMSMMPRADGPKPGPAGLARRGAVAGVCVALLAVGCGPAGPGSHGRSGTSAASAGAGPGGGGQAMLPATDGDRGSDAGRDRGGLCLRSGVGVRGGGDVVVPLKNVSRDFPVAGLFWTLRAGAIARSCVQAPRAVLPGRVGRRPRGTAARRGCGWQCVPVTIEIAFRGKGGGPARVIPVLGSSYAATGWRVPGNPATGANRKRTARRRRG